MPRYRIALIWEEWGVLEVEANSLEEAEQKAMDEPNPPGEFIDDSTVLDKDWTFYGEVKE